MKKAYGNMGIMGHNQETKPLHNRICRMRTEKKGQKAHVKE